MLYKKLLPLSGMGPFTAANMLQLLGHYERIAADTETARHLKHRHKIVGLSSKTLQEAAQKVLPCLRRNWLQLAEASYKIQGYRKHRATLFQQSCDRGSSVMSQFLALLSSSILIEYKHFTG